MNNNDITQLESTPWKRNPLCSLEKRTTMPVRELQYLFGICKTETYWLLHKSYFDTVIVNGNIRIDIRSFEHWYANQDKYIKRNGPPPGSELREKYYTVPDIAKIISRCESSVCALIQRENIEHHLQNGRFYVPRQAFDTWLQSQSTYSDVSNRETEKQILENSLSPPEIRRLLDLSHRNSVYAFLNAKCRKAQFEYVSVHGQKRVTKESFYRWYENQTQFRITTQIEQSPSEETGKSVSVEKFVPKHERYYTIDELETLFGFSRSTIYHWIRQKAFPAISIGNLYRIPKDSFNDWYNSKAFKKEGK